MNLHGAEIFIFIIQLLFFEKLAKLFVEKHEDMSKMECGRKVLLRRDQYIFWSFSHIQTQNLIICFILAKKVLLLFIIFLLSQLVCSEDRCKRCGNCFGFPGGVRSLRTFEEVVVDLVEEFEGWERRSSGKCTILLVFLRKRRRWAFSFFLF